MFVNNNNNNNNNKKKQRLTIIVVEVLFIIWDFKRKCDSFDGVVILVECFCIFDAFRITEE